MAQSVSSVAMIGVGLLRAFAQGAAMRGGGGEGAAWWLLAVLGGLALAAAAALTLVVVRRRRRLGAEMARVFAHVASALDDPLLVHQAQRRIRQAGDR